MSKFANIVKYIIVFILLLGGIAGVYSWYRPPEVKIVDRWHEAETPKVIAKIKKVEVPIERIVVIEKEAVSKELKLPDEIKNDKTKEILAVAEIPPYAGKTTAIAILDTDTKETKIDIRHEPLPFIGFENQKEFYLKAGYALADNGFGYNIEVGAEWKFLRIANFHLGLFAQADINKNIFAGAKLTWRN